MVHWNRIKTRKLLTVKVLVLFVLTSVTLFVLGQSRSSANGGNAPKLELVTSAFLPIEELSGVEVRPATDTGIEIVTVGDHTPQLASATIVGDTIAVGDVRDFSAPLAERFSLCAGSIGHGCTGTMKALLTQWEAIRVDGAGTIFMLQEYSRAIIAVSADLTRVVGVLNFDFGLAAPMPQGKSSKEKRKRLDDHMSGEGFILLKNGHFLVAKEKTPVVLAEFGPAGEAPLGLSAETLLPGGEAFKWPEAARVAYQPLATWQIKGPRDCDISEIAASRDGKLYLLSQSCRILSRVDALPTQGGDAEVSSLWRLPKKVKNPEGLVVLDDGRFVVGSDQRRGDNVFVLEAQQR